MNASAAAPVAPKGGGKSPLIAIFLTVFIDLLGFGIVIPLLPVYTKAYGASEVELGLLFSAFSLMQFLFAPMWGRWSDRIGRRPILIGGLFGTAASYALFAVANYMLPPEGALGGSTGFVMALIFASRFLAGFFGANISTAQAYIADVTTQENRAKGMGLIGAAFGLGFTVGPLVGGELSALGTWAPGAAAALFSLASATFAWFKLPEPDRHSPSTRAIPQGTQVRHVLAEPRLGVVYVLIFLSVVAWAGFEAMFTRFGLAAFPTKFGLEHSIERATVAQVIDSAKYTGRYLFFIGVVSAIIQGGLIRRLVKRYGEVGLSVAGPFFLAISFAIVAWAGISMPGTEEGWMWVLIGCGLMPLGFGLNNPALNGLVSRAAPEDQQGAYLGLYQSTASLARVVGPPLTGAVFKLLGAAWPFVTGAGLLFLAAAIAWWYRGRYGSTFARGPAA